MTDPAILRTRLSQAEDALHRLTMGEVEVKLSYDGKTVEFAAPDVEKLERYVARLRAEIGRLSGKPRRPIYFSF